MQISLRAVPWLVLSCMLKFSSLHRKFCRLIRIKFTLAIAMPDYLIFQCFDDIF